ncbi:DDE superfamily endonuclease domain-containing protein [Ditylenchus destructor]|uniref:DDE superfamily endonuclease domain-containing protein n=1 Tax=Ditylenchus destructor TaxID=166010 RepID=A0AAD4RAT1_9BILA|nr:DDE superfamily endonuclease domain-containing protein [Ditylenchus destructor]
MKAAGRQIVLVLDNHSSHVALEELSNIKIVYLPPNMTSKLQLTDESIIAIVTTESEESEEDEQEGLETVMEPTQIKDAIAGGKAFLSYLEQNQVASGEEILTVMNLTDCLVDEEIKKRRQAKITEFCGR